MMYAVIKKMGGDQIALEYSNHATREEAQREADATGGTVHSITDMARDGHAIYLDPKIVFPCSGTERENED